MSPAVAQALDGLKTALDFSGPASMVGCAVAAALAARGRSVVRWVLAGVVCAVAWLVGEGAQAGAAMRPLASASDTSMLQWMLFALGLLGGLVVGYLVPTWTGIFVGRRVTWGTGFASAAVVAVGVSRMMAVLF